MSSELGSAHVAIIPSFKGFRKATVGQVEAATKDAGNRFRRGFGKAGVGAGATVGSGFRRGFHTATSGLSDTVLKRLRGDVASTARAVSNARLQEQDAAGRVRVAEAALAEGRKKWGAESSRVLAGEERLASAQRKLAHVQGSLTQASARLTTAKSALSSATTATGFATSNAAGRFGHFSAQLKGLAAPLSESTRLLTSLSRGGLGTTATRFTALGGIIGRTVTPALNSFGVRIRSVTQSAATSVSGLSNQLGTSFANSLISSSRVVSATFAPAVKALTPLGLSIGTAFRAGAAVAAQAASMITPAFSAAMKAVKSVASDAADFVGSAFKGTAVAVAAVVGTALVSGFRRLSSIETARAKLTALGNSAESVTLIMNNALAAVKGTAFALDEAATVAASAVAAGIKPGKELEKYLKLTADAATIAGISMSEMGSIINKTTTQGRAYTKELNQLANRGIPIYQWLAKEYGVTADALRDMVEQGKVDAATYRKVIEENISGAALASGNTTRGAFANMKAAHARFGASLLSGAFPLFKDLLNTITAGLDAATARVQPFADAVGGKLVAVLGPPLEKLRAMFDSIKKSMADTGKVDLSGVSGPLAVLAPILGLIVGLFSTMLTSLPLIGQFLPAISGPLGVILGLLAGLLVVSPELRAAFSTLFTAIGTTVGQLAVALGPVVQQIIDALLPAMKVLGGALATVLTAFIPLLDPLVGLIAQIAPLLPPIVQLFAEIAVTLAGALSDAIVALMPVITQIVSTLGDVLGNVLVSLKPLIITLAASFGKVMTALGPLIPPIMDLIGSVLKLVDPILKLIGPLLELVGPILTPLIDLLTTLIAPIIGLLEPLIKLLKPIMDIVSLVIDAFLPVLKSMIDMFKGVIEFISGVFTGDWSKAWNGIVRIFSSFGEAIGNYVNGVVKLFGDLPCKIGEFFAGAGRWLWDAGAAIVQGLIDGIGGMARSAVDAVTNLGGKMIDGVKGFLGIHSPSRRFRVEVGHQVAAGVILGMDDKHKAVAGASRRLVNVPSVNSADRPNRISANAQTAGTTVTVNQQLTMQETDGVLLMRQMAREAQKWFAAA